EQEEIMNLINLEELNLSINKKINNLNHLQKLRRLDCKYSNINISSINKLNNIETIICSYRGDIDMNSKILYQNNKNIEILTDMEILDLIDHGNYIPSLE